MCMDRGFWHLHGIVGCLGMPMTGSVKAGVLIVAFMIICFGIVKFDCIFGCTYREVHLIVQSEATLPLASNLDHYGYKTVCLALGLGMCITLKILFKISTR